jgi:hypothetical protein
MTPPRGPLDLPSGLLLLRGPQSLAGTVPAGYVLSLRADEERIFLHRSSADPIRLSRCTGDGDGDPTGDIDPRHVRHVAAATHLGPSVPFFALANA